MKQNTYLYLIVLTYSFYMHAMQSSFDFEKRQFCVKPIKEFNQKLFSELEHKLQDINALREKYRYTDLSHKLSEIQQLLEENSEESKKKGILRFGTLITEQIYAFNKDYEDGVLKNKSIDLIATHQVPIIIQNLADNNEYCAQAISGLFLAIHNQYEILKSKEKKRQIMNAAGPDSVNGEMYNLAFYSWIPNIHLSYQYLNKAFEQIQYLDDPSAQAIKNCCSRGYQILGLIFHSADHFRDAYDCYYRSANLGNLNGAYNFLISSWMLWEGRDEKSLPKGEIIKSVFKFLEKNIADAEHPELAYYLFSEIYSNGMPHAKIEKNYQQAKKCFAKLKEFNGALPKSITEKMGGLQYQLGKLALQEAEIVPKNNKNELMQEAEHFYHNALRMKYYDAAYDLSLLHHEKKEYEKSLRYFLELPVSAKHTIEHINTIMKQYRSDLDKELITKALSKCIEFKKLEKQIQKTVAIGSYLLVGLKTGIEENSLTKNFEKFVDGINNDVMHHEQLKKTLLEVTENIGQHALIGRFKNTDELNKIASRINTKLNVS